MIILSWISIWWMSYVPWSPPTDGSAARRQTTRMWDSIEFSRRGFNHKKKLVTRGTLNIRSILTRRAPTSDSNIRYGFKYRLISTPSYLSLHHFLPFSADENLLENAAHWSSRFLASTSTCTITAFCVIVRSPSRVHLHFETITLSYECHSRTRTLVKFHSVFLELFCLL